MRLSSARILGLKQYPKNRSPKVNRNHLDDVILESSPSLTEKMDDGGAGDDFGR